MDISNLTSGEWMEREILAGTKEDTIRLKLRYFSLTEIPDIEEKKNSEIIDLVCDLIVDWGLTDGDKKVECNAETKAKYVPYIMQLKLKDDPKKTLAREIMKFTVIAENFTKN